MQKVGIAIVVIAVALICGVGAGLAADDDKYDVVIANGRVMDPESGLDAVWNVGIRGARFGPFPRIHCGECDAGCERAVVAPDLSICMNMGKSRGIINSKLTTGDFFGARSWHRRRSGLVWAEKGSRSSISA
jgi:hypothetical protein